MASPLPLPLLLDAPAHPLPLLGPLGETLVSFLVTLLLIGAAAFLGTLLLARIVAGLFGGRRRSSGHLPSAAWDSPLPQAARPPAPAPAAPAREPPARAPPPPPAHAAPARPTDGPAAGPAPALQASLAVLPAPPLVAAPLKAEPLAPLVSEANGDTWPTEEEWTRLFHAVMAQDSILRDRGRGLSRRRSLQSVVANLRDRDLLYEKGLKMGAALHSASYPELAEHLRAEGLCTEARFDRPAAAELEAVLLGTAMAREAPNVGTCLCFVEAGLLAGALGNLERRPLEVREVKCVAKGDPYCAFRATHPSMDAGEGGAPQ